MAEKTFYLRAKLIEGDPFGLHDPLTVNDLIRIDEALADGSVEGAEADRLRAISAEEHERTAEMWAEINPSILASLPKIDLPALMPKIELAFPMAEKWAEIDFSALIPRVEMTSAFAEMLPKFDFSTTLEELSSALGSGLLLHSEQLSGAFAAIQAMPEFASLAELGSVGQDDRLGPFAYEALIDHRPAHMEDLATRQLQALDQAAAGLHELADAIDASDQSAAKRHAELKHENRIQVRTVVLITIVAAVLSGLSGAYLSTIFR